MAWCEKHHYLSLSLVLGVLHASYGTAPGIWCGIRVMHSIEHPASYRREMGVRIRAGRAFSYICSLDEFCVTLYAVVIFSAFVPSCEKSRRCPLLFASDIVDRASSSDEVPLRCCSSSVSSVIFAVVVAGGLSRYIAAVVLRALQVLGG